MVRGREKKRRRKEYGKHNGCTSAQFIFNNLQHGQLSEKELERRRGKFHFLSSLPSSSLPAQSSRILQLYKEENMLHQFAVTLGERASCFRNDESSTASLQ